MSLPLEGVNMNKFFLLSAFVVVVHGFSFAVGEATEIKMVRRALSAQDVIACSQSLVPVVEKLARGGYFLQGKNKDEVVREILFNALDRRVSISDGQLRKRFSAIEFMMRQSSVLQMRAYDDQMTSKIMQYYCDVKRVPESDLRTVIETARKKDAALIAAGKIAKPAITIGHSATPNLRVARDEVDKIRNWNTLVSRHRLIVGRLLSVAVKRNFECLPEDLRMKKYLELVSATNLSRAEIEVLIADGKIRTQLVQGEKD